MLLSHNCLRYEENAKKEARRKWQTGGRQSRKQIESIQLERLDCANWTSTKWRLLGPRHDDRWRPGYARTTTFKLAIDDPQCSDHEKSNGIGTLLESTIGALWNTACSRHTSCLVQLGRYAWLASNGGPYGSACTCHGLTTPVARYDAGLDDAWLDDAAESVHGLQLAYVLGSTEWRLAIRWQNVTIISNF